MAAAAVWGLGGGIWSVMWSTSVQTQVPGQVLNRIHAYEVAGSLAMMPVGQALAGPAAELFGGRTVLLAGGFLMVGVSGALLAVPAVRNLRAVTSKPAPAPRAAGGPRRVADPVPEAGPGTGA